MELDGYRRLLRLVVFAECGSDVLVAERRVSLLPVRTGLRFWSRLELGGDDRVEAATLPVTETDPPVLACAPEDLERCFVGRLNFLREQLFPAVGEIEPEGYEHARKSMRTARNLHKTWMGF